MSAISAGYNLVISITDAASAGSLIYNSHILYRHVFLALAATIGAIIFVFNVIPTWGTTNTLDKIRHRGELVVLTRNSPTTYYEGPYGPAGLEYDLAKHFADYLGVKLKMIAAQNVSQVLAGVQNGAADFAAAGLTITKDRKEFFRFGPPYQKIHEQLIYNVNNPRPKSIDDLNGVLEVMAYSSHNEQLIELKKTHPKLTWKQNDQLETEDLLQLVSDQVLDYTVVDSNEFMLDQRFMLNLRAAFNIGKPEELGWLFPKSSDNSLYDKAKEFFKKIRADGELKRLIARTYGHTKDFDYVGTLVFRRHIVQRLPRYRQYFEEAAKKYHLDWRLLAAMGYQESHWNPKAISPTGVRGIMMLTQDTANHIGIENRLKPKSSIMGGAAYFSKILKRMPKDIPEPDRTWMALAAYNVGMGHLEDARIITEQRGKDPHRWFDVKQSLPLLAKRRWYKNTKHGYARGWEPLQYVENIRSYYDILRWLEQSQQPKKDDNASDALSITPQVP